MSAVDHVQQNENQQLAGAIAPADKAKTPAPKERKALWMLISFCVGLVLLVALNMR